MPAGREESGTILICAMGGRFPLYYGVGNGLSWYVAAILPDYPSLVRWMPLLA